MSDRFDSQSREFRGGPEPFVGRVTRLLSPKGGSVGDGVRLATINLVGIVIGMATIAVVALLTRLLRRVVDVHVLFTGFFAVLILIAIAVWIWYRYADAHVRAARRTRRAVKPDVYGAVAAAPFAVVAMMLLSFGFLSLFFAVITFSGSRAGDALRQLSSAVVFAVLAIANVIIARLARDRE